MILENMIIGKLVLALVDDGFRVEISNQDGGGWFIYAAADGGEKPPTGYEYWVRIVPGNGADVIVDYTTNLEAIIAPINDYATAMEKFNA